MPVECLRVESHLCGTHGGVVNQELKPLLGIKDPLFQLKYGAFPDFDDCVLQFHKLFCVGRSSKGLVSNSLVLFTQSEDIVC